MSNRWGYRGRGGVRPELASGLREAGQRLSQPKAGGCEGGLRIVGQTVNLALLKKIKYQKSIFCSQTPVTDSNTGLEIPKSETRSETKGFKPASQ